MRFQKISILPPQRVTGNSEGEGDLKGKNFKEMYEPKLEFPKGWGFKAKKVLCRGSMDIFWNSTFRQGSLSSGYKEVWHLNTFFKQDYFNTDHFAIVSQQNLSIQLHTTVPLQIINLPTQLKTYKKFNTSI